MKITKVFDKDCLSWSVDLESNKHFVKSQIEYAHAILKLRGYLFLNEVYDYLGMPRTKHGHIYGWIYSDAIKRAFISISTIGEGPDIEITFRNLRDDVVNYLQED